MKPARLDELSDGIFAIVMTLLVFEIKIPIYFGDMSNMELWNAIKDLAPSFASYILSFTLLFTYWRAHHFFISVYAKNIDSKLTNLNALFFLFIALIPFSSSLLGQYSSNELAITIFGVHITLIGLTLYWIRKYVFYSDNIRNPEISQREIHGSTVRTLVPVFIGLIAIPISFFSPKLSLTLFTLVVIFNLSSYSTHLFGKMFKSS